MFEPRWYRKLMTGERFISFQVAHFETDLWIGVDPYSYHPSMEKFVLNKIIEIRMVLNEYIQKNPGFKDSLVPIPVDSEAHHYVNSMIMATQRSETGPFSSVAGLFAREVGASLIETFHVNEVIVENGGDLYISVKKNLEVSIYAGTSPLSNKIGIEIPAEASPLGLCTSSATVGHSLSFGNTDATTIICSDAVMADAFATRFGNEVKTPEDISAALSLSEQFPEIWSILIILGDQLGIKGKFNIKPLI